MSCSKSLRWSCHPIHNNRHRMLYELYIKQLVDVHKLNECCNAATDTVPTTIIHQPRHAIAGLLEALPNECSTSCSGSAQSLASHLPHAWASARLPTSNMQRRPTTVLCVRKGEEVVMVADGQVRLQS